MKVIDIEVGDCEAGTAGKAHRKSRDHYRWNNGSEDNRDVTFDGDVPAIFLGSVVSPNNPLNFVVPAHGSIEFELDPNTDAEESQDKEYHYTVTGKNCRMNVGANAIIVGP